MKKHFYSLFSVFALSVFVLISCTTENALITPIKSGINSEDYQSALVAADTAIANDPTNGQANYYKAYALGRIAAQETDVSSRKPIYQDMRESLDEATRKFEAMEGDAPSEADLVPILTQENWGKEHNAAIAYATNDSVMASVDAPLEIAIAHLLNATTINPDSALSHDVLAQVYHMNSDYANAAVELSKAIEIRGIGSASDYDRLASYYFVNEDFESASDAIEEGLSHYPDSTFLIQKQADAYFQIGRTDRALEVVNQLIERDPNNAQYHLVVGTQIYQRVQTLGEELESNNDRIYDLRNDDSAASEVESLNTRNEEIMSESDDLTSRAEESLVKAAELDPSNSITFNTLGILYQNKAAALFELRNMTTDNDKAAEYDELAKAEAEKAMVNYETAAELNPDDTEIWATLFRIYTLLDYREKAEAAMEKAGM